MFQKHARASATPKESCAIALKADVEAERFAGLPDHGDAHQTIEGKATEVEDILRVKIDDVAHVGRTAVKKKTVLVTPGDDLGEGQRPDVNHFAGQGVALDLGEAVAVKEHLGHQSDAGDGCGSLGVGLRVEDSVGGVIGSQKALLPITAIDMQRQSADGLGDHTHGGEHSGDGKGRGFGDGDAGRAWRGQNRGRNRANR